MVGDAHDEADDVLDHDQRHAALVADAAQQAIELLHPGDRQPDRRLVEQHDLRVVDQRARDLDDALLAERERVARPVGELRKAHVVERLHGARAHDAFFLPHAARAERAGEEPARSHQVHAGHHVLEHAHAGEKLRRLERAAQSARGNQVGLETDQALPVEQ